MKANANKRYFKPNNILTIIMAVIGLPIAALGVYWIAHLFLLYGIGELAVGVLFFSIGLFGRVSEKTYQKYADDDAAVFKNEFARTVMPEDEAFYFEEFDFSQPDLLCKTGADGRVRTSYYSCAAIKIESHRELTVKTHLIPMLGGDASDKTMTFGTDDYDLKASVCEEKPQYGDADISLDFFDIYDGENLLCRIPFIKDSKTDEVVEHINLILKK